MDNNKNCGCNELDSPTQVKTINVFRDGYCKDLYVALGEVIKLEVKRTSLVELIQKKQCWFIWTERHYRIYRNLEMMVGAKLVQTNDSIKDGVNTYLTVNKTLAESLKKIAKTVKEVRAKVVELKDMSCKLDDCMKDNCNCSQMIELTGEVPDNCKDQKPPSTNRPSECSNIKDNLKKLVNIPKALKSDIDSISKSSFDIVGIQTFSNVTTLGPLQAELGEDIKKFYKGITDAIKQGEGDLKTVLEDLTKTQKEFAKAEVELYAKRTDFEGIKEAVAFFCCPVCGCIDTRKDDTERLKACEEEICKICKDNMNPDSCKEKPEEQRAY